MKLQSKLTISDEMSEKIFIIPPSRIRYLSEISENNRNYDQWVTEQSDIANKMYALDSTIKQLSNSKIEDKDRIIKRLKEESVNLERKLHRDCKVILDGWEKKTKQYKGEYYIFKVRDKEIKIKTHTESLSHSQIPKVAVPRYEA